MNPWTCIEKMTHNQNDRFLDVYLYYINSYSTTLKDTEAVVKIYKIDKVGDAGPTIINKKLGNL